MSGADVAVREATGDDLAGALNVLDGAALAVDYDCVSTGEDGTLLVALADGDTVLGSLVLDGDRIAAVAVRRRRRGQGIGTALVEAAADRRARLIAEFDADVRPFYESLAFECEPLAERDRVRGVRAA